MENYDNIQELDALRQQVREFKERLDRQEIVSERMLRSSMRSKMSWIRNFNVWVSVVGLFFMPIVIAVLHYPMHISWPPIVALTLLVLGEAVYNIISTHPLRSRSLGTADLITAAQRLRAYKRREQWQMIIEMPLLLIITIWIAYEVATGNDSELAASLGWTALVGASIGGAAGIWFFFKEMSSLNQIVDDIDEFKSEK